MASPLMWTCAVIGNQCTLTSKHSTHAHAQFTYLSARDIYIHQIKGQIFFMGCYNLLGFGFSITRKKLTQLLASCHLSFWIWIHDNNRMRRATCQSLVLIHNNKLIILGGVLCHHRNFIDSSSHDPIRIVFLFLELVFQPLKSQFKIKDEIRALKKKLKLFSSFQKKKFSFKAKFFS